MTCDTLVRPQSASHVFILLNGIHVGNEDKKTKYKTFLVLAVHSCSYNRGLAFIHDIIYVPIAANLSIEVHMQLSAFIYAHE